MELTSILMLLVCLQLSGTMTIDCPTYYSEYSGHCYSLSSHKSLWKDARKDCQSDLVSVNDEGEDNFLKDLVRKTPENYWMGMVYTNGRYEWFDGTGVGYTDWESGEPSCMDEGRCNAGYFRYNHKWIDYSNGLSYYICELVPTTGPTTTVPSKADLHVAVHLDCQNQGWHVTIDLDKLSQRPSNVSEIYMNEDTCVGTLQGGLLVFNKTYQECNTRAQVVNETMDFYNYLIYATRDSNDMIRYVRWRENLHCSHAYQDSHTINIETDITQQGTSSGQVPGSLVDIKLYTDSAFSQPLQGTVKLGAPVYVQVLSLGHPDVAMVVNACQADVKTKSSQIQKLHPLIQDHCSVESSTSIIAVRNQVTRFRFNMFDLPNDDDGIHVTCNIVFCDPMDFSSKCEQTCKTSSTLVG